MQKSINNTLLGLLYYTVGIWMPNGMSTRIKDAGIAIRHSRGRILFYTAGSRNGLERVVGVGPGHKKEVVPKKKTLFCYRKIYWDARQEEVDVPDPLEAIMRPTCLVKEELRPNLFKLTQFRPEITKIRICTFQMSGKKPGFVLDQPPSTPFSNYLAALAAKYSKKIGF